MSTDATLSARVAEEIRAMLARRGINKSELARRLNVSHTWVTNRLAGHQDISLNEVDRIARVLDVPLTDLLPQAVRSNGRSGATSPIRVLAPRRHVKTRPNRGPRNGNTRPPSGVSTMRRRARLVHDQ